MNTQTNTALDFLVVGSGFVAQETLRRLCSKGLNVDVIDLSLTALVQGSPSSPLLSWDQLKKTKTVGGGTKVWGGAVSSPIEPGYLRMGCLESWKETLSIENQKEALKSFGVHKSPFELEERDEVEAKDLLVEFNQENLRIQKHAYSRNSFTRRGRTEAIDLRKITPKSLLEIVKTEGHWRVRSVDANGVVESTKAKSIVLASGAVLNAVLAFEATGINRFNLGNHCSTTLLNRLPRVNRRFSSAIQRYRGKNSTFLTFGKGRLLQGDSDWAFRLVPTQGVRESFKANWSSGLRSLALMEDKLNAQLMIEVSCSTQDLVITKDRQTNGYVLEWTEFNPSNESVAAQEGLQALEKHTIASHVESAHSPRWVDAAHYFGTIPMTSTNGDQLSVNSDFEIRGFPGIFSLGSSVFPTGGHSHPTLAAVMTAVQFSSLQ